MCNNHNHSHNHDLKAQNRRRKIEGPSLIVSLAIIVSLYAAILVVLVITSLFSGA